MIEINLLPKEQRKRKIDIPRINISFLPILAVVLGIHVLVYFSAAMKTRTLTRLEKRWQEILPEKENADGLTNELTRMRGRIDAIDGLIQGRMGWAEKLSDLSDAIIPGVWLNRLWLEQKIILQKGESKQGEEAAAAPEKVVVKTLHLDGSVIATGGEEAAAIGKFIRSLQNNKKFFADFKEIEATSIQRSQLKDVEVMDFELVCYFK